jgi:hypothetical protein
MAELSIWHCSQCSLGLRIPSLHAKHPSTVSYTYLVGHVCCIRNIPQYRLTPAEYRQPNLPSSYQLHHLVLGHLCQVVKNPPCLGFESGTSRTKVRRSNHYTISVWYNMKALYGIIWKYWLISINLLIFTWCAGHFNCHYFNLLVLKWVSTQRFDEGQVKFE